MKHALVHWDKIAKKINAKYVLLFLDYDGTLTPIVSSPEKANISSASRKLLGQIAENQKFHLAIISGRSLKNIKKKVGIKNITYAGNHGLQLEGAKIKFSVPLPQEYRHTLYKIKKELEKKLSQFKGFFIENKGLTLSLHYRNVNPKDLPGLKAAFQEAMFFYSVKKRVRLKEGKKVFEIRPPLDWDKGKIVLWLFARQRFSLGEDFVTFYIGDDKTDEDAFRALKGKGLTVFVGKNKDSLAEYFLKNSREVLELLQRLYNLKQRTTNG